MAEWDGNLEDEIRRQVKEQFDRTIEIPDGLTEEEAVASVIEQYKKMTGVQLSEADVRGRGARENGRPRHDLRMSCRRWKAIKECASRRTQRVGPCSYAGWNVHSAA